jgi:hypothetical protein
MAMYVDIMVRATLKIQDPIPDEAEMKRLADECFNVTIESPFETTMEDFQYSISDAD